MSKKYIPNSVRSKRKHAFINRRKSLARKCAEFSIITGKKVTLFLIDENRTAFYYSSGDINKSIDSFIGYSGCFEFYCNKNSAPGSSRIIPIVIQKEQPESREDPLVLKVLDINNIAFQQSGNETHRTPGNYSKK